MAEVKQLVCDRCGKPIQDRQVGARVRLTRYDRDYHGTRVDLCTECSDQFKDWIDNPTSAPVGYEFRPRPCPHKVPCVEGCSGSELVPINS